MIWSYWEGALWNHIETCLASMRSVFGNDFTLVTPGTLEDYLPVGTIHENFKHLPQPALKADCVRAALLAEHGGWWMDADTVAIEHPKWIPIPVESQAAYMIWDKPPVRVLNGYIYFRPGSPQCVQWLDSVNRSLADDPSGVSWCSLGEGILTNLLYESNRTYQMQRRRFLPIDIDSSVADFFRPLRLANYLSEDTVCFGLNHSWFVYHHWKDMLLAPDRWCGSPKLIHQLLGWARKVYQ